MRASDYKKITDKPTELIRITLTEKDGTETVIDLDAYSGDSGRLFRWNPAT